MKVYVVIAGYYSDRHVAAVTLDREKAELLRERFGENDVAGIEEWNTDYVDDAYEAYRLGYYQYGVSIQSDDTIRYCLKEDEAIGPECDYHDKSGSVYYVWAKSKEVAEKIAIDRHAMWKAQQEGIS